MLPLCGDDDRPTERTSRVGYAARMKTLTLAAVFVALLSQAVPLSDEGDLPDEVELAPGVKIKIPKPDLSGSEARR
jgi:hypothetical protein